MSAPTKSLRAGLIAALKGKTDAGNSIFDKVMPGVFPRISLTSWQAITDDPDCVLGYTVYAQIDVYSNLDQMAAVEDIADQITKIVHTTNITTPDHNLISLRVSDANFSRETDNTICRARMTLRAYLEEK